MSGHYRDAMYWYREASTYKGYKRSAKARILRIRRQLRESLRAWNAN